MRPGPKPSRPSPIIPAHYRVRHDKIDRWGAVSLRHNSRLHHIGLGTRLAGTPVTLLIDDLHIRDHPAPHRRATPRADPGPDPGLPAPRATARAAQTRCSHTSSGIPIPAQPAARSRGQGWPQATRRAPALTPARTAHTIEAGMPKNHPKMQRCPETPANGVPRHHNGAPGGIRTPNLLIRRSRSLVRADPFRRSLRSWCRPPKHRGRLLPCMRGRLVWLPEWLHTASGHSQLG